MTAGASGEEVIAVIRNESSVRGSFEAAVAALAILGVVWLTWTVRPLLSVGTAGNDALFLADGARRIAAGQIPHVDFPLPVGSLPYFAWHWAEVRLAPIPPFVGMHLLIFLALVPLVAAAGEVMSRPAMLALVAVAAMGALAPFNLTITDPQSIAFHGAYNRFAAVAALVWLAWLFSARRVTMLGGGLVIAWTAGFLIAVKFVFLGVVIGPLVVLGAVRGDLRRASAFGAMLVAAGLALVEMRSGAVSGYVGDVRGLAAVNEGRIVHLAASFVYKWIVPVALVAAAIGWRAIEAWRSVAADAGIGRRMAAVAEPAALAAALAGIVVGESQSTGGLEITAVLGLALTPALLPQRPTMVRIALVAGLIGLVGGELVANTVRKSLYVAMARQGPLVPMPLAETYLGRVGVPAEMLKRAQDLAALWTGAPETMRRLEGEGRDYVPLDYDRYLAQWVTVAEALAAIPAQEKTRLGVVSTLTMADLFGLALAAPPAAGHHLAFDPGRTVAPMSAAAAAAYVATVDTVFEPTCAIADGRPGKSVVPWFRAVLAERHRASVLTACWTMHRRIR